MQALHTIKALKQKLNLVRMKMRIRVVYPIEEAEQVEGVLGDYTQDSCQVEGGKKILLCLIDPDVYRKISKLIPKEGTEDRVRVEIVDPAVADFPMPVPDVPVVPSSPTVITGNEDSKEELKAPVPRGQVPTVEVRKFGCTMCPGANFSDMGEQRAHFKSDWHKVNLKHKVASKPLLLEPEFQLLDQRELDYWLTLKNL